MTSNRAYLLPRQLDKKVRAGVKAGLATDHPSFEMSCCFKNQTLVLLYLVKCWKETSACICGVCLLPGQLGEHVATLQLPALGAVLAVFAQEQAVYFVVKVEDKGGKDGWALAP